MTGRKWSFHLYPLAFSEIKNHFGFLTAQHQLETRLVYGNYPEVVTRADESRLILQELATSYLFKDIQQQEIDYLEEYDGQLHAYEFKWNPKAKANISKTFTGAYPGTPVEVITSENLHSFLSVS